ncbi:hypothetical protein BKA82DRAFT_4016164 [Pisolithus tinctorius]|nr:hypothetical protein BKA82DRAFT_4016164 [Pisolithus tinctorius]
MFMESGWHYKSLKGGVGNLLLLRKFATTSHSCKYPAQFTNSSELVVSPILDQKPVRWRPGSLDTCSKWSLNGLIISQHPLLRAVAPSWDSPPLLLSSQQPSTNHRGDDPVAAHSILSLAAIAPSWDLPTSLPAHAALSLTPVSFVASPLHMTTQPPTQDHLYMDEGSDAELTADSHPLTSGLRLISQPSAETDAAASHFSSLQQFANNLGIEGIHEEGPITTLVKARWLAILLSGPASDHPMPLNTATNGPIVTAYNHYSNILAESSIRFWLLLARQEQVEWTQQYIEDLMTMDLDGEDEVEIDDNLL